MRHLSLVIFFFISANCLHAQVPMSIFYNEDSLRLIFDSNPHDSVKIALLLQLAGSYFLKQPDSSLMYATQALEMSRASKSEYDILISLSRTGEAMRQIGDLAGAMKMQLEALGRSQKLNNEVMEANSYGFIGSIYLTLESYDNAINNLKKALTRREILLDEGTDFLFLIYMARAYNETDRPDSAFFFLAEAKKTPQQSKALLFYQRNYPLWANVLGDAFLLTKNLDSANFYYRLALESALKFKDLTPNHVSMSAASLSKVFIKRNMIDSALYFARLAYMAVHKRKIEHRILNASVLLAQLHRKAGQLDSALYYHDIADSSNASIYGKEKSNKMHLLLSQEQKRHEEMLRNEERIKSSQQLIGLVSITTVILIASILLFRSNRIKQKTNLALQQTLKELRSTQSQLVQSEKMASLGELTAGIAHEIQNPLNFVNNFSEVNTELISEMKKEMAEGNGEAAAELANTIEENEQKINHHGKRADGIVKSMLLHSGSTSGQKELTDINSMCDEYLRLAYHGYRAREKMFNATVETKFDEGLPKINIVRQDIGRVILNLVNNAFYEVTEKSKAQSDGYSPAVNVSTKRLSDKIEVCIKDNGRGISKEIKEKIFQPFFSTKPTGQGTGLGLSLSYDIVKAHGGTLEVNSEEDEGSEFVIRLLL